MLAQQRPQEGEAGRWLNRRALCAGPAVDDHEQGRQDAEGEQPAEDLAEGCHHAELVEAAEAGQHERGIGGRGAHRRNPGSAHHASQCLF